jgi:hypothetical protein
MKHLRRFRWSGDLPIPYAFEFLFVALGQRNHMEELYFSVIQDAERSSLLLVDEAIPLPLTIKPISLVSFM